MMSVRSVCRPVASSWFGDPWSRGAYSAARPGHGNCRADLASPVDDRLFFANARYVKDLVREAIRAAPTETSWFVFDAETMMHVDSTGMEALASLATELRGHGITLVVARLPAQMRRDFELAGLTSAIGDEHFYPSVERAVAALDGGRAAVPSA